MLLTLCVFILYIVDILIICIAVYLAFPELSGALKNQLLFVGLEVHNLCQVVETEHLCRDRVDVSYLRSYI